MKQHLNSFANGMSVLDPKAQAQSNYSFGLNGRIYSYKNKLAFTSIKGNRKITPPQEFITDTKEIVGSYSFGDLICLITITNDPDIDQLWTMKEDINDVFTFTKVAEADLNLQDGVKCVCRGVKENQAIQTIYWTDGFNPLRRANILDPDLLSFVEEEFNLSQEEYLDPPIIESLGNSGAILPMNSEYIYRLVNAAGVQTDFSLPSQMISILKTYGQASGEGELPGIATSTNVRIQIDNINEAIFDRIEVYVKEYEVQDLVTDIKILYDGVITGSTMFFDHIGAETEISSGLDSALLTVKNLAFDTCEYIETKDNRLFAANLKLRNLGSAEIGEGYLTCKSYDNLGNTYPDKFNPDHSIYKYVKLINGNLVRGAESEFFSVGSGIRLTFVTQQEIIDKRFPDNDYATGVEYLDTITTHKGNRSYQREEIYRMMYALKVKDSVQYSYAEFCCDLQIPSNGEEKLAGDYNDPSGLHQYPSGESLRNTFDTSFVKKVADDSEDFVQYGQAIYIKVEYRNELGLMDFYSSLNILRAIRTDSDKTILDQGIIHPFHKTLENSFPHADDDYDFDLLDGSSVGARVMPGNFFVRWNVTFVPASPPLAPYPGWISTGESDSIGPNSYEIEEGVAVDSNVYYLASNTFSASQYYRNDQLSEIDFSYPLPWPIIPTGFVLSPVYSQVRIGFRPDLLSFDSPQTVLGINSYDLFENYKVKVIKRGTRNTYLEEVIDFSFTDLGNPMPYIRSKFNMKPIMYNASNDINLYNGDWYSVVGEEAVIDSSLFTPENGFVDGGLLGLGPDAEVINNNPMPIQTVNDYDEFSGGATPHGLHADPCRSAEGIQTFILKTKKLESLKLSYFNHKDPGANPVPPFPTVPEGGHGGNVFGLRESNFSDLGSDVGSYRANLIVNITRELISQYGGNNEAALFTRGYINCLSINIDPLDIGTGTSDIVKDGDIYIDAFEYAKHNLSQYRERYDDEAFGDSGAFFRFNDYDNGYLSSMRMILETPVPLDFSNGTTVERTDLDPYDSMGYEYNPAYFSESDLFYYAKSDKQIDLGENIDRCSTVASSEIKLNGEFIDSWAIFRPNNFYEMDIDRGCIFNLIKLNNEIHLLQAKNGLARLYINSRQLIQDDDAANVLIKNTLGDGGPIETHVYVSKYGSAIKDCYVLAKDYFIYFSEVHKKLILSNGQSTKVVSEELGIQAELYKDIVSGEILDVAGYFDEVNSELVLSIITDQPQSYSFSYSDLYRKANGFYSHTSPMHIVYNEFILSRNNLSDLWEYNEGLYLSFYGVTQNFELEFIVNGEFYDTKIFDNFRSDIISVTKANKIIFESNLMPQQEILETDRRYRVREAVHIFPYRERTGKDRMRGSYLKVRIIFENKNELISIFNVVSIYRKSYK